MPSGIQILEESNCIVIVRFVITAKTAGNRIVYGVRDFVDSNTYVDSVEATVNVSSYSQVYSYIRVRKFDAKTYLRPIASVDNGGICNSCAITIVALKSLI